MPKMKKPTARNVLAAITKHDLEKLSKFLADSANPNGIINFTYPKNVSLLSCAAGIQFASGVDLLLKSGADPNIKAVSNHGNGDGQTALHAALTGSDTRPGSDTKRSTDEDRYHIVDALLRAGCDPNAICDGAKTPAYLAAIHGNLKILQRLIEGGACFKVLPGGCDPPLFGAAEGIAPNGEIDGREYIEIAKQLLDLGAPVDGQTQTGVTSLMMAVINGCERLIDLFLRAGANVNHRSKDGRNPLICAAIYCEDARDRNLAFRIVKRLVEAGADPNMVSDKGYTPFQILACSRRCHLAADYLRTVTDKAPLLIQDG